MNIRENVFIPVVGLSGTTTMPVVPVIGGHPPVTEVLTGTFRSPELISVDRAYDGLLTENAGYAGNVDCSVARQVALRLEPGQPVGAGTHSVILKSSVLLGLVLVTLSV